VVEALIDRYERRIAALEAELAATKQELAATKKTPRNSSRPSLDPPTLTALWPSLIPA
jgi:hypothetical protein